MEERLWSLVVIEGNAREKRLWSHKEKRLWSLVVINGTLQETNDCGR